MLSMLLSTLPFAALAAADLTTSIWKPYVTYRQWPSTYVELRGFYASVVDVNNDRTTLVGRSDDATTPSMTLRDPKYILTMTVGPSYYNVMQQVHDYPYGAALSFDLTWTGECTSSSKDAAIVCTEIINGPGAFASICSQRPKTMMTQSAFQLISGYPQFCFTDTTVPIEYLANIFTVGQRSMTTFSNKVVITAGEEKLSATTGATPNTGAEVTGGATTGSGTGGAGPMKTSAPLLAGLGAAMAVFAL